MVLCLGTWLSTLQYKPFISQTMAIRIFNMYCHLKAPKLIYCTYNTYYVFVMLVVYKCAGLCK